MEGGGEVFDELAEVYPLVGDIVEDGLVAVALILHIAYLHLQTQVLGYLPTLYHRAVLAALSLLPPVDVVLPCYAVDASDVVARLEVGFLQLQLDEPSCERHHTDVVSGIGFHSHDVALLELQVVDVVVIALSGVLELHLDEVGVVVVSRHVGQPVVGVELLVLPSAGSAAESAVAAVTDAVF